MPPELDYGDYNPYPPTPDMQHFRQDYITVVEPWPKNDPASTQYYWHLYHKGEHVNGGICDNEILAWSTASHYKASHQRQEFLKTYLWDEESMRWQPREYFMR